jgi:hypothetical protein
MKKFNLNGDFLADLHKNEEEEVAHQFTKDWMKYCNHGMDGEYGQKCFSQWLEKPFSIYSINYKLRLMFRKGDKVKCTSTDPKLADIQGKIGTVYGKNANYIFVSFNEDLDWKLLPSTLVKVGQEEKIKIKLGQLFCIKIARMRPGYTADTLFKIVWKSSVNVRVVPLNPKYPMEDFAKHVYGSNQRPGDHVTEYTDETRKKYFRNSVYRQDIPIAALVAPDQYDKEDLDLVMDLDDIGL